MAEIGNRLRGDLAMRRQKIASLSPAAIAEAQAYADDVAAGRVVSPKPKQYHQAVRQKLAAMMAEAASGIPELMAEIAEKEASLRDLAPKQAAVEGPAVGS